MIAPERRNAALWGGLAAALLGALIVIGSRNLQHFDAALVGYTFATLFAAFGIAYRYAMWLQRPPTRETVGDLSLFLSMKLLLHPLIAFALVSLVSADPLWLTAAVLMAALPPATNVFVLATQYGRFVDGASNAVLVGTAASAVTVTAVLYAIRSGVL